MSKPSANVRCVANSYAHPDQRIIEIGRRDGKAGALLSLAENGDGLHVEVYRADPGVTVAGPASPLHAAAPDMLAALKRCEPWIGRLIAEGVHKGRAMPCDAEIAMRLVSEAIAKAEGRT